MYFHAAFERIANWKFKGSLDIHTFFTKWERDMFFHQIVKLSLYFPQNPDWRTTQLNVLELAMNYALKFPIVRLVSPALPDHYLLSNVWCGKRERIFDSSWNGISSSIVLMPCLLFHQKKDITWSSNGCGWYIREQNMQLVSCLLLNHVNVQQRPYTILYRHLAFRCCVFLPCFFLQTYMNISCFQV